MSSISNTFKHISQKCRTLNHLKQFHAHILKFYLPQNPFAVAPLLSVAATTSNNSAFFSYACLIFQYASFRSAFMYNTMIRGHLLAHSPVHSIFCYLDMLNQGLPPNHFTFPPLIKSCSSLKSNPIGCKVHSHVVMFGLSCDPFVVSALIEFYCLNLDMGVARKLFDRMPERDVVLWTTMIDGYGKMGEVGKARELFEEMPERDVITWSSMMAAYSRVDEFREVLSLFTQMQEVGKEPNESILVSVLTACAHLGALAEGMWIHSFAKRYNLKSNTMLATALVDMYSKCGCLERAISVFEDILHKDVGSWNAMISGASMSQDARQILCLFDRMTIYGAQPTAATFVALFAACTHAKLVDEGLKLFEQMDGVYGVKPQIEHYACVVDLLARAGMLKEAENFIHERMGGIGKGDANVWGALLGGCRTYGNVEIADRIWKMLATMGVSNIGTHILAYNIYKEAGWEIEATRVRRFISEREMKKQPGRSVIEVNGGAEEFVAGDRAHIQLPQICEWLDSIFRVMYRGL